MSTKNLRHLVSHFPETFDTRPSAVEVTGISLDSRAIEPGNLFVALQGASVDGHQFIPQALARGAAVVVGTGAVGDLPVPYLQVSDSRLALAQLSAAYYDFPARKLIVIGVTGTDGKTTTANLVFHILRAAQIKAGMISTVNAQIGETILDTGFHVTTPEAPLVQSYLAQMVAKGITHVVLEATSHGLAQKRVAACEFDIGVVTNITHEHLDYHGSFSEYFASKSILLTELSHSISKPEPVKRLAVLNQDDESYDALQELVTGLKPEVGSISYGFNQAAEVRATDIIVYPHGLSFSVAVRKNSPLKIESTLVGAYNVSNCLAAIAATAVGLGTEDRFIQTGVQNLRGIPGRMEVIDLGQDYLAIVDFAHTPNALKNSLQAARRLSEGRVIAIFGSAGLRDREKRGLMAEISGSLADLTILTAEDPRSESLDEILEDMAVGITSAGGVEGRTFWRIPDRGEAIRFGLSMAHPGDVAIACGKGHEQSMCFGDIEYAWDDRTAMRAALGELLGLEGPTMPYLPTQEN